MYYTAIDKQHCLSTGEVNYLKGKKKSRVDITILNLIKMFVQIYLYILQ